MSKYVKFFGLLSAIVFSFALLHCGDSQKIVTKAWTRQVGSADLEEGNGVAVDSLGNIYVTGRTRGRLDGSTNAGFEDIFLLKYDSSGNKLWIRQLGSAKEDYGNGVAIDSLGNIYVTGYTSGGLDGNTNAGSSDIFLLKYDSSGNKLWTRQLGSASWDMGNGVAVDSLGNIYVTGMTSGGLDGNTNAGEWDIFLLKYDSSGNKLWTRQLGSTRSDYGHGVAVDSLGNIYVTGYTSGGLDGNTNAGEGDIFLLTYDSSGNKLWTRQLGSASWEMGKGIAVDSLGNIYVTGITSGGLDGNINAGYEDIFLLKYDSSGNKLWTRQLGSTRSDYGHGVAVDSLGNIYVTGKTRGRLDGNIHAGGEDIFLVKFAVAPADSGTISVE